VAGSVAVRGQIRANDLPRELVAVFLRVILQPQCRGKVCPAPEGMRERLGVEMLSIGAFLSVLVVLGAGGVIQPETLGTLLGTVAGYLFARRTMASNPSDTSSEVRLPGKPVAPTWDAANRTLKLPSPALRAESYGAWLGDLTTKKVRR
jgi:hypothetical protein